MYSVYEEDLKVWFNGQGLGRVRLEGFGGRVFQNEFRAVGYLVFFVEEVFGNQIDKLIYFEYVGGFFFIVIFVYVQWVYSY